MFVLVFLLTFDFLDYCNGIKYTTTSFSHTRANTIVMMSLYNKFDEVSVLELGRDISDH